jgi:hypothetical protein
MLVKPEFIDDFYDVFTQIGKHDEEELEQLGLQSSKNISLDLDALSCLRFFPNVTSLILRPGCINEEHLHYLYSTPIKRLKLDYYSDLPDEYAVDLSKFSRLSCVFSRTQFNFRNANKSMNLTTLIVQEWCSCDLQELENDQITSLKILSGKLKTLKGIGHLYRLRSLSLSHQRALMDVSDLANCRALESLEIDSCNKLDMNEIPGFNQLKNLVIEGRQTIKNCDFFL